jgi:hypothetical protein
MTVYDLNKRDLPDLDQFPSSNNDFLKSIAAQATTYPLTPRQIEAAKNVWARINGPKFDEFDRYTLDLVLELFVQMKGMSGYGEWYYKLKDQLRKEGRLSDKQMLALREKMVHYRKALIRRAFRE